MRHTIRRDLRSSTVARASSTLSSAALLLGLVTAALSGCAASSRTSSEIIEARYTGTDGAPQYAGADWQAVFLPPVTEQAVEDEGIRGEWDSRNDQVLAARDFQPVTASDRWPEGYRPTLDRQRTLSLPRQAETYLYFRDESARWRR